MDRRTNGVRMRMAEEGGTEMNFPCGPPSSISWNMTLTLAVQWQMPASTMRNDCKRASDFATTHMCSLQFPPSVQFWLCLRNII